MLVFFNMGGWEIIIVVGAIYLLFGPKKIPEIARQLGKVVNEFRRATDDIKREIKKETSKLEKDLTVDIKDPIAAGNSSAKQNAKGAQTKSDDNPSKSDPTITAKTKD